MYEKDYIMKMLEAFSMMIAKIIDNQSDAFSVVRFEKISSLEQILSGAGY